MTTDINHCECPTITYPNGGEVISDQTINIQWDISGLHGDISNDKNWYDLFFTDSYDPNSSNNWMQIASVPSNAESFVWSVPFPIKSSKCRIGIRCRNLHGAITDLSISADDFSISKKKISVPALVQPVSGQIYRQNLPIVFDHSAILGKVSQRSSYSIFYSSQKKSIDWTLISEGISIGKDRILIDISGWEPSDDYALKVILTDVDGSISKPAYINDIKVSSLPYFILDSLPPISSLNIDNNTEFTNSRDVVLSLNSVDEATETKNVEIKENDSGYKSLFYNDIITWKLSSEDGTKSLTGNFVDYAGNDSSKNTIFPIVTFYNEEVTCIYKDSNDIYFTTKDAFFKGRSQQFTLPSEVTIFVKFKDVFYFGILKDDNKGSLYKESTSGLTEVYEFTDSDSRITAMASVGDDLYIGNQNGDLYKFNGTSVEFVSNRSNVITELLSDNVNLYVFVDNEDSVGIYDGSFFVSASVIDGYK